MGILHHKLKQNPRLEERVMSDGRISLFLEYYLGRSETPVYDSDGKRVFYESGAMKGKPKYNIKHIRRKETLRLYIYSTPDSTEERRHNKETLLLAEKIRFEREQELLEDSNGYRLRPIKEPDFIIYFKYHCDNDNFTSSVRKSYKYALSRFQEYLALIPKYCKYTESMPLNALTSELVIGFTNYLRTKCRGDGVRKNYYWFKKVVTDALDDNLIKKNPCKNIRIVYERNVILKEILTPKEIQHLASFHYTGENSEVRRAFLFCCFTGLRYCDVAALKFGNIDYRSKFMRFQQKKNSGRSCNASVITPLNRELMRLIGRPNNENPNNNIFNLPHIATARKHLARWVNLAGLKKHITWHCSRHSFAVNLLNSGTDIKTVSSLMGHSSIIMTEKYLHVTDQNKQKAINRLGKMAYKNI